MHKHAYNQSCIDLRGTGSTQIPQSTHGDSTQDSVAFTNGFISGLSRTRSTGLVCTPYMDSQDNLGNPGANPAL